MDGCMGRWVDGCWGGRTWRWVGGGYLESVTNNLLSLVAKKLKYVEGMLFKMWIL